MTREKALKLLKQYNESEALVNHGKAVEAVMKAFAKHYQEDQRILGKHWLIT